MPATLVHPRAIVGPETVLGPGCLVMGGAYVSGGVRLGAVLLGDGATADSNAVVLQGRRIGANAFVGAAVVIRDVPPGEVVVGSPAGPLRKGPPG
ncbi:hypothetical protein ACFVVX_32835 [Kitasatospora sp. NPDC058170]|uniref:hypothetical protein n=1 Tax=Kitasatospora sp. NPDC058170 TaxID=3346364 RepID=UPI0036DAD381